jgi:hypothetical protein
VAANGTRDRRLGVQKKEWSGRRQQPVGEGALARRAGQESCGAWRRQPALVGKQGREREERQKREKEERAEFNSNFLNFFN